MGLVLCRPRIQGPGVGNNDSKERIIEASSRDNLISNTNPAESTAKSRLYAMVWVATIAVFALPAYALIGVLTIPVGVGLFMLTNSSPWLLNLYPFLFAGTGTGYAPVHYLNTAISLPLTIAQWTLISYLSGLLFRDLKRRWLLFGVAMLVLAVGLSTSAILSVLGITLVSMSGHM